MLDRFVLNEKGVGELLKSDFIVEAITKAGETVKNNAGDGYSMDTLIGDVRAVCRISAETKQARDDAYENNSLLKAMHK